MRAQGLCRNFPQIHRRLSVRSRSSGKRPAAAMNSVLHQDDQNPMPTRHWPAVDYQAHALVTSGVLNQKAASLPSSIHSSRLVQDRKQVLEREFLMRCREAFVANASNASVVPAGTEMFHRCLAYVCRECGATSCPSMDAVERWLRLVVPGDNAGQVLGLEEFVQGVRYLCPSLFKDFEGKAAAPDAPGNPANSYRMLQRKFDATGLAGFESRQENTPAPGANRAMVLVANPGHVAEAVKKDGRRSRHLAAQAGVQPAPLGDRKLEKTRIVEAMNPGPPALNAVRAAREAQAVRKARQQYASGLAAAFGSNMTMVQRHVDIEGAERLKAESRNRVLAVVKARRARNEDVHDHCQALKQVETAQRRVGRKHMKATLSEGHKFMSAGRAAEVKELRDQRDVLRWSEYKSGIIARDEDLDHRKANATSRKEWEAAVSEDSQRQAAIHHERLTALARARGKAGGNEGSSDTAAASVQLDGSGVFSGPYGSGTGGEMIEPPGYYGFLESPLDLGSVVEPPMSMKAAARAFGVVPPARHPGFLSSTSRE